MKLWHLVLGMAVLIGTGRTTAGDWVIVPTERVALAPAGDFTDGSNIFPNAQGKYNGLIAPFGDLVPEYAGYFRLDVTPNGTYSGKFVTAGNSVPLHGWFNSDGLAGVSIYKWVWDDCHCFQVMVLVWTVEMDLVPNSDELEGTVINHYQGGWSSEMYGLKAAYVSNGQSAPQEGRYTLRLPGSDDPTVAPPGDGYGAVTVNKKGQVKLNGAVADGVKITDDAFLSFDGYWPVYVPLNNGHGLLFGWLKFNAGIVSGELTWDRPYDTDRKYYPAGFVGTINARGGPYLLPPGAQSPLTWTEGQLRVVYGNVTGAPANDVTFQSPGSVTVGAGDLVNLKVSIKTKTGLFSGTFKHPETGNKTSYAGALFQFDDVGGGYFLGIDQGGTVSMAGFGLRP